MLHINKIEKELFGVRAFKDRRKKVNRIIVSYIGDDGYEYRKSFEFPRSMNREARLDLIPKEFEQ